MGERGLKGFATHHEAQLIVFAVRTATAFGFRTGFGRALGRPTTCPFGIFCGFDDSTGRPLASPTMIWEARCRWSR